MILCMSFDLNAKYRRNFSTSSIKISPVIADNPIITRNLIGYFCIPLANPNFRFHGHICGIYTRLTQEIYTDFRHVDL